MQAPLARPIQFDEHHALPGAQQQAVVRVGYDQRGAEQRREDMIGRVRGIVRVAVRQLWQQVAQRREQIEVGARIKVGSRQGAGGMRDEQCAKTLVARLEAQGLLDCVGDIDDLIFGMRGNGQCLHRLLGLAAG